MIGQVLYGDYYHLWELDYEGGMSLRDIASRYGCSRATVTRYLSARGLINKWHDIHSDYHNNWIELYKKGSNTYEIGDMYNCSRNKVSKVIKDAGVMRTKGERQNVYADYYNEWIIKYNGGMSITDIGDMYGCNSKTVWRVLNRNNVMRVAGETTIMKTHMRHSDTDMYFDSIDTEDKAYYLGILYADGCIHFRKYGQQRLSISLKMEDAYIVENLASIFRRNTHYTCARKMKDLPYIHKDQLSVSVLSDHICNTLKSYGFTERKSSDNHEAKIFDHIPDHLMNHFIRGIIDGNGSIGFGSTGTYGVIQIAGNKQDMCAISDIFYNIGCRKASPHKNSSIYALTWSSRSDTAKIIHYLYDNANIYFHRKRDKAMGILALGTYDRRLPLVSKDAMYQESSL